MPGHMRIVSVNVSLPRNVEHAGRTVRTGIFKEPVAGRAMLGRLNLTGDGQADLENHGGEHKAVYAYPVEHYDHWRDELGRHDLVPGQFGENLTVVGLTEETVNVGDIFRMGDAVVQVSQPRSPCFKLGIRMGLPDFPKRFLRSGLVGFYLRVLEEGLVGADDAVVRERAGPADLTVRAVNELRYGGIPDRDIARHAMVAQELSPSWRRAIADRLEG